jgi:hypothetical protein
MGDSSETFVELQNGRSYEQVVLEDHIFGSSSLSLDEDSFPWILNHIDCFVSQSRGNKSVAAVHLCPDESFNGHDDDVCEKVGQAIGNLQALETLRISTHTLDDSHDEIYYDSDGDYVPVVPRGPIPDWEILARILKHVRQNVTIVIDEGRLRTMEEVQPFVRAISGHPTITSFDDCGSFPYEYLDTLFSTLTTLPALKSVSFGAPGASQADESNLARPESLTELLRVPTLRFVCFNNFYFTRALCQATSNALKEGTAITKLEFFECSFSAGENSATIMASGLSRNTSVVSIQVAVPLDQTLHNALTAALPSNSTLRCLALSGRTIDDDQMSPFFLALGKNTGLKSLKIAGCDPTNESLSTAMNHGLGMNATLESLEFNQFHLTDDNSTFWLRALSFLRTNNALKSLVINLDQYVPKSCILSAFSVDTAAILQENASLERLSVQSWNRIKVIKVEEYIALVAALQYNTTLKTLRLYDDGSLRLTDDEDKQMASLLKKNYALESLPRIGLVGDAGAILRLNEAGRRYLIQDGSSISRGVEVLSRVNNEINCVFLHLLENPSLCDRSAVEKVSASESDGSSTNLTDGSSGGKREQASAHNGKESRRRLV